MNSLDAGTARRVNLGLTVLRVFVGLVFVAHGALKVFAMGLPGVTQMFTHLGVPLPSVFAVLICGLEIFGGAALMLGLLTRFVALFLAADMLGAVLLVKIHGGFFAPRGAELELTLLFASIALALSGAGAPALDNVLWSRRRIAVPAGGTHGMVAPNASRP